MPVGIYYNEYTTTLELVQPELSKEVLDEMAARLNEHMKLEMWLMMEEAVFGVSRSTIIAVHRMLGVDVCR